MIVDIDEPSTQGASADLGWREIPDGHFPVGDAGRGHLLARPLPLDATQPADTVSDAYVVGGMHIAAASVRGLMHRHNRTPRQDAYAVRASSSGDWAVAVVCDGVGSKLNSHLAAALAADVIADEAASMVAVDPMASVDWEHVFDTADAAIQQQSAETGDRATTVTAVLLRRAWDTGLTEVETVWVGDSPAWILQSDGFWLPLIPQEVASADEFVDNRTDALPHRRGPIHRSRAAALDGATVLVMTDGIGTPLGDGTGELGAALASWWSSPVGQHTFAAQVDFERRSFTDDRTCVAMWLPHTEP